jgi:hypothetical protein
LGLITVIGPDEPLPMTATIKESDLMTNDLALIFPNDTAVAVLKFTPLIRMESSVLPVTGAKLLTLGTTDTVILVLGSYGFAPSFFLQELIKPMQNTKAIGINLRMCYQYLNFLTNLGRSNKYYYKIKRQEKNINYTIIYL